MASAFTHVFFRIYFAFLFSIMSASLFILFIIINAWRFICPSEDGVLMSHPTATFRQSICIVHTHFCFAQVRMLHCSLFVNRFASFTRIFAFPPSSLLSYCLI